MDNIPKELPENFTIASGDEFTPPNNTNIPSMSSTFSTFDPKEPGSKSFLKSKYWEAKNPQFTNMDDRLYDELNYYPFRQQQVHAQEKQVVPPYGWRSTFVSTNGYLHDNIDTMEACGGLPKYSDNCENIIKMLAEHPTPESMKTVIEWLANGKIEVHTLPPMAIEIILRYFGAIVGNGKLVSRDVVVERIYYILGDSVGQYDDTDVEKVIGIIETMLIYVRMHPELFNSLAKPDAKPFTAPPIVSKPHDAPTTFPPTSDSLFGAPSIDFSSEFQPSSSSGEFQPSSGEVQPSQGGGHWRASGGVRRMPINIAVLRKKWGIYDNNMIQKGGMPLRLDEVLDAYRSSLASERLRATLDEHGITNTTVREAVKEVRRGELMFLKLQRQLQLLITRYEYMLTALGMIPVQNDKSKEVVAEKTDEFGMDIINAIRNPDEKYDISKLEMKIQAIDKALGELQHNMAELIHRIAMEAIPLQPKQALDTLASMVGQKHDGLGLTHMYDKISGELNIDIGGIMYPPKTQ